MVQRTLQRELKVPEAAADNVGRQISLAVLCGWWVSAHRCTPGPLDGTFGYCSAAGSDQATSDRPASVRRACSRNGLDRGGCVVYYRLPGPRLCVCATGSASLLLLGMSVLLHHDICSWWGSGQHIGVRTVRGCGDRVSWRPAREPSGTRHPASPALRCRMH